MQGIRVQLTNLVKILSVILGFALATMGVLVLTMAATASIRPESGRMASYAVGTATALLGVVFSVWPFSKRIAKSLAIIFLLAFASLALWLVFSKEMVAVNSGVYQVGAISLAVLLTARIVISLRNPRPTKDS